MEVLAVAVGEKGEQPLPVTTAEIPAAGAEPLSELAQIAPVAFQRMTAETALQPLVIQPGVNQSLIAVAEPGAVNGISGGIHGGEYWQSRDKTQSPTVAAERVAQPVFLPFITGPNAFPLAY